MIGGSLFASELLREGVLELPEWREARRRLESGLEAELRGTAGDSRRGRDRASRSRRTSSSGRSSSPRAGPSRSGNRASAARGKSPPHPHHPSGRETGIRLDLGMRGTLPTGRWPESLPRFAPPSFAGRENPPRTPPRRRYAPCLCPGDFRHSRSARGMFPMVSCSGARRRRRRPSASRTSRSATGSATASWKRNGGASRSTVPARSAWRRRRRRSAPCAARGSRPAARCARAS